MKALLNKPLLKTILSILVVLAPIQHTIFTVFILVAADLALGLFGARRRKEKITSAGLRRTVSKLLMYEAAICLGYITQIYMTDNLIPVCNIVSSFIGISEFVSILEHADEFSKQSLLKI